ncbi:hypothetical protein ACI4CU_28505, partial [Klebsiella pneumoniae]|uniref:hypothetical protein n=1 Tax=Klebsiella pneumoniae TaxID=573 RepID=UPI0038530424
PEIPGWHLHWFKEENVPLALDAYYEHVDKGEVKVNQQNVALDSNSDGGTDLGSRISIVTNTSDKPIRAYLMKIKEEYFQED